MLARALPMRALRSSSRPRWMATEELVAEASATVERLVHAIDDMELSSWFTGKYDHGGAIVTIKPGQGGLEAQDWTFMLFKMYMKYCARRGWKVTVNDCPGSRGHRYRPCDVHSRGQGTPSGMLRAEAGVHRLVRISPNGRQEAPPDDVRGRRGHPGASR